MLTCAIYMYVHVQELELSLHVAMDMVNTG